VDVGNCCFKDGVFIIDLRECDINDLSANIFLYDNALHNQTHLIEAICLNENPIGPKNVSVDAFRGIPNLKTLILPPSFTDCQGGNKFWDQASHNDSYLLCEGQKKPCNISGEICPDKSHCVDDGPGMMRCLCNDGYYGYKCLKSGQFPYGIFYGCLAAATVVLSGVLWFVGRRKIGLHTKQS